MAAGVVLLIAALTACACSGCHAPIFLNPMPPVMISEAEEVSLGAQAYQQALADKPMSQNRQLISMVNRVGRRIAAVADRPDYDWEFRVIASDDCRIIALPGGKVAVCEGVIPICRDEAGLAAVLSHEIAHLLAQHGTERLSQNSPAPEIGGLLGAVSQQKPKRPAPEDVLSAYGAGSTGDRQRPYSLKHEAEADAIGLILMAKAGYDPSAAPEVWARLNRQPGSDGSSFVAAHPDHARRLANLREMLPEARNYYRAAPEQLGMGRSLPRVVQANAIAEAEAMLPPKPLPRLTSAPDRSRQSAVGPPPPPSKNIEPNNEVRAMAANSAAVQHETFLLPVVAEDPSPPSNYELPLPEEDRPLEDGWREATGRAFVQ